jgi:hypothetical protein
MPWPRASALNPPSPSQAQQQLPCPSPRTWYLQQPLGWPRRPRWRAGSAGDGGTGGDWVCSPRLAALALPSLLLGAEGGGLRRWVCGWPSSQLFHPRPRLCRWPPRPQAHLQSFSPAATLPPQHTPLCLATLVLFTLQSATMTTRKRKNDDEELVALPSDESEEEEEYVCAFLLTSDFCPPRRTSALLPLLHFSLSACSN